MKPIKHKKLLAGIGLGFGVLLLTGCTANFCSPDDKAAMAYPYDQGATVYLSKEEYDALKAEKDENNNPTPIAKVILQEEEWSATAQALGIGIPSIAGPAIDGNPNIYKYVPFTYTEESDEAIHVRQATQLGKYTITGLSALKAQSVLNATVKTAIKNNYQLPSIYYFGIYDDYALKASLVSFEGWYTEAFPGKTFTLNSLVATLSEEQAASETDETIALNPYTVSDTNGKDAKAVAPERSVLRKSGKAKFLNFFTSKFNQSSYYQWNEEIATKYADKGFDEMDSYALPSTDFRTTYRSNITAKVSAIRSCIATRSGYYGHYGQNADWRVEMQVKDWGYAWSKGFLEGLLVYPVSWLTDTFAHGMDPALSGAGQIWAIIFVTLIIRGLLMAVSFRSTMDGQKMQALQPELAKLQAKYPNSNTSQVEKQRLSQEQMALYRRHKVKPFRQILVLIVQFPVFICVWSGLQGASSLATGEFLNLSLSDTIQQTLFNVSGWPGNAHGWWTALVLFLLMAGTQIMAMLLPKILQRVLYGRQAQTQVNNAQNSTNKTMKYVSIGMMAFTIIMGFMLPSAMGVYWFIGGVMSMLQTLITQLIMAKAKKRK